MAVVIAVGVNREGQGEVLGVDVGPSEDGAYWLAFLRGLVARGLTGVRLVTSDSHQGLKGAIQAAPRRSATRTSMAMTPDRDGARLLLTIPELAAELRVDKRTVYRLLKAGKLQLQIRTHRREPTGPSR